MSNLTDSQRNQIWKKFQTKAYRDAFVSSHISTNIAAQIHAIREAHGWTQKELADAAGMAQTRVSVMEDPSYDRFALRTLRRLASAFDVALVVRFIPFSELLDWTLNLGPDRLVVPPFSQEQRSYGPSSTIATKPAWYGDNVVELLPGTAATQPTRKPGSGSQETETHTSFMAEKITRAS